MRRNEEAHIQAAILLAWGAHPRLRIARVNTGAAMLGGRLVKFGVPGTPDICGVIKVNGLGVFIGIEVKALKGKQRKSQIRMQRIITQLGGLYCVARSVDDVDQAIEQFTNKAGDPCRRT